MKCNPWNLDIENERGANSLATCRELGVTTVAYSPLGRGILSGQIRSIDDLAADDTRRPMNRWNVPENFAKTLEIVDTLVEIGKKKGVTSSQLALAWVLKQGEDISSTPGTERIKYLEENVGAAEVDMSEEEQRKVRRKLDSASVAGV